MQKHRKIRVYIKQSLIQGRAIETNDEQNHYILKVMRCHDGDSIKIFNQEDGEWDGALEVKNKVLKIIPLNLIRAYEPEAKKIILAFAPTKKYGEFSAEKATEMGIDCIIPIKCQRSVVDKINYERYVKTIVEASEQCGRLNLPQVADLVQLKDLKAKVIELYPCHKIKFILCDFCKSSFNLRDSTSIKCIIIGPEGGFGEQDYKIFHEIGVEHLNLGNLTLRAETACIAAVANVKSYQK